MCVLSVVISDNVSCVVCGTEALLSCARCMCVHFCCVVLLLPCVLASVVSCESHHIIVYCVRGNSSLTL